MGCDSNDRAPAWCSNASPRRADCAGQRIEKPFQLPASSRRGNARRPPSARRARRASPCQVGPPPLRQGQRLLAPPTRRSGRGGRRSAPPAPGSRPRRRAGPPGRPAVVRAVEQMRGKAVLLVRLRGRRAPGCRRATASSSAIAGISPPEYVVAEAQFDVDVAVDERWSRPRSDRTAASRLARAPRRARGLGPAVRRPA